MGEPDHAENPGREPPDRAGPPLPVRLLPDVRDDLGPNTPRPLAGGEPLTEYGMDVLLHNLLSVA
jgi:hypothetical protein